MYNQQRTLQDKDRTDLVMFVDMHEKDVSVLAALGHHIISNLNVKVLSRLPAVVTMET